jgi:hypothetical protein
MNPESRPMTFTTAMPLGAPRASTCAARITSAAFSNAVA